MESVDRILTYLTCSDEGGMDGWSFADEPLSGLSKAQVRFGRLPLTYFNGVGI